MQKTLLLFLCTSFCAKLNAIYDNTNDQITTITLTQLSDNTYKTCVEKNGIRHISKSHLERNTLLLEGDANNFQIPTQAHKFVDWEDDEYFGYSYKLQTNEGLVKMRFVMKKTCTLTCKEVLPYEQERFDALQQVLYTTQQLQQLAKSIISLTKAKSPTTYSRKETNMKFVYLNGGLIANSAHDENLIDTIQLPRKTDINPLMFNYQDSQNNSNTQNINLLNVINITTPTLSNSCMNVVNFTQPAVCVEQITHKTLCQTEHKIYTQAIKPAQFKTHTAAHGTKREVKTAKNYSLAMIIIGTFGLVTSLAMLIPNFAIYGVCALLAIMTSCDACCLKVNKTSTNRQDYANISA